MPPVPLWITGMSDVGRFTLPFMQPDANLKARLAYAIREARIEAGMSRGELAKQMGVNAGAPRTWELGKSVPHLLNLGALCDALGVSAELFAHPPEIPERESPVTRFRLEREIKEAAEG